MGDAHRIPGLFISIAPTTPVIGKRCYDLPGTIELMQRLWQEAVVDGFEFQNLAEWDAAGPPLYKTPGMAPAKPTISAEVDASGKQEATFARMRV